MGGELTLNQFRYTTTNNRDFVIGDPSDTNEQPRYMVFQVNSTPGYASNPHIKAEKVGDNWQISISEDGATPLNFAFIDRENYFTYPNHFQAPTTFTSDVEINADLTVQGQAFNPSLVGSLSGNNSFTGYNTFTKDIVFDGTVSAQGRILGTNKNILLNSGGATSSAVGAGFDVAGDGGAVIAYVRNTASGMTLKSTGLQPVNLTGDATYGYTIKPAAALGRVSNYVLPVQAVDTTSIVTAPIVSGTAPFTVDSKVIVNSDTGHVIQSDVTLAELQHLRTADDYYIKKGGDYLDDGVLTFGGVAKLCFGSQTNPEVTLVKTGVGLLKILGTGTLNGLANQGGIETNQIRADVFIGNGAQLSDVDSVTLGGLAPVHYDCGGSCSWTCMTTCKGSCSTTCTGTCTTGCSGTCSTTCTGSCSTTCTGGCSTSCTSTCSGSCGGTCSTTCLTTCTANCKNSCAVSCTSCTGACSGSCSGCSGTCSGCTGHSSGGR